MFPTATQLTARAELYLCLARALQPPGDETHHAAFRDYLPGDLAATWVEAGYPVRSDFDTLATATAKYAPDQTSLLRIYSRLFLVPPIRVSLNAGVHLDNTVMGTHSVEITTFYREHGVEGRDDSGNMPDHLSVQLEFIAYLLTQAVEETPQRRDALFSALRDFGGVYLAPWLPRVLEAMEREMRRDPVNGIYLKLIEFVHQSMGSDLVWLDAYCTNRISDRAPEKKQTVSIGAAESPTALRMMIRRLEEAGLDAGHLRAIAAVPDSAV